MSDMNTMPVRELIADMRKQISEMDNKDFIKILVLNVLVSRIEKEADRADKAEAECDKLTHRLASMAWPDE